jgi:hypothetical protein
MTWDEDPSSTAMAILLSLMLIGGMPPLEFAFPPNHHFVLSATRPWQLEEPPGQESPAPLEARSPQEPRISIFKPETPRPARFEVVRSVSGYELWISLHNEPMHSVFALDSRTLIPGLPFDFLPHLPAGVPSLRVPWTAPSAE